MSGSPPGLVDLPSSGVLSRIQLAVNTNLQRFGDYDARDVVKPAACFRLPESTDIETFFNTPIPSRGYTLFTALIYSACFGVLTRHSPDVFDNVKHALLRGARVDAMSGAPCDGLLTPLLVILLAHDGDMLDYVDKFALHKPNLTQKVCCSGIAPRIASQPSFVLLRSVD